MYLTAEGTNLLVIPSRVAVRNLYLCQRQVRMGTEIPRSSWSLGMTAGKVLQTRYTCILSTNGVERGCAALNQIEKFFQSLAGGPARLGVKLQVVELVFVEQQR